MQGPKSTKEFIKILKSNNELFIFEDLVDPELELAEIHRRVVANRGPALLFTNVKGSKFSVATNLYGSTNRLHIAFGNHPEKFIREVATLIKEMFPFQFKKIWKKKSVLGTLLKLGISKSNQKNILKNSSSNLFELPTLKSWPEDGGRFITLPLVYTEHPTKKTSNLGMYRIQIFDETTTGMHIQIHRGGGFHYYEAEKVNESLPAHIYVGGPPALTLSAIAPLPEEISELIFASLLLGTKIRSFRDKKISTLPIMADADFVLIGQIPPKIRRAEGPFGDHYGYYSLKHDFPIFQLNKFYHAKDAIWPATIVGKPPQEDHWIAEYLQDLMSPLFPIVMPQVKSVWAYEESGVHSLASAVVKERYKKEAFNGALRILGEGQLSLTKFLIVTDEDVNLKDFKKTFTTILQKTNLATDLMVFSNISQDTLDYTNPNLNEGSKGLLLGVGEIKNQLTSSIKKSLSSNLFRNPIVFCPGALVVQGEKFTLNDKMPEQLLEEEITKDFLFIFLVDNSVYTTKSNSEFIWTVFTQFDPGRDLYSKKEIKYNQVSFTSPVVVDCRWKNWYPKPLESDPKIKELVDQKFGKKIDQIKSNL